MDRLYRVHTRPDYRTFIPIKLKELPNGDQYTTGYKVGVSTALYLPPNMVFVHPGADRPYSSYWYDRQGRLHGSANTPYSAGIRLTEVRSEYPEGVYEVQAQLSVLASTLVTVFSKRYPLDGSKRLHHNGRVMNRRHQALGLARDLLLSRWHWGSLTHALNKQGFYPNTKDMHRIINCLDEETTQILFQDER